VDSWRRKYKGKQEDEPWYLLTNSLKDGHLGKLLPIRHFQQQVTPNYASYRYTTPFAIATKPQNLGN